MQVHIAHGSAVDLALLDVGQLGWPVGFKVVDTISGSAYTLTESAATVDHDATESVFGISSLRWVKDTVSGVTNVTGTAPIASSGGATPAISIAAATTIAAGSMSAADKTKVNGVRAYTDFFERYKQLCFDSYPTINSYAPPEDFMGSSSSWFSTLSGAGSAAAITSTGAGGHLNLDVPVSVTGFAIAQAGTNSFYTITSNIKTSKWFVAAKLQLTTGTVDNTTTLAVLITVAGAAPIAFGVFGATSTTKLCMKNNATITATATDIPTLTADFELAIGFDGTTITYYLNGVSIATQTDLSGMATTGGHVGVWLGNGTNQAHKLAVVDKWFAAAEAA